MYVIRLSRKYACIECVCVCVYSTCVYGFCRYHGQQKEEQTNPFHECRVRNKKEEVEKGGSRRQSNGGNVGNEGKRGEGDLEKGERRGRHEARG